MSYPGLWWTSYVSPRRFAEVLASALSPRWGFFAALQRGLMDSLFTYLPVVLRLANQRSDMDRMLSISVFASLSVGSTILCFVGMAVSLPFAVMFMRSPA